jgi:hypothetical protein
VLKQLADERRDVNPLCGHRPSSGFFVVAMRMTVAFYVRGISTSEVHPEFPPRAGTLARLELEVFGEMAGRESVVALEGWDEVTQDVVDASRLTQYLWFPRARPDLLDRVEEANRWEIRGGAWSPATSARSQTTSPMTKSGTARTSWDGRLFTIHSGQMQEEPS